jgi:hypothetical protein
LPQPTTVSAQTRNAAAETNAIFSFDMSFTFCLNVEKELPPRAAHYTILSPDCKAQMQKNVMRQ